jgi:chromosome segregation ATPase
VEDVEDYLDTNPTELSSADAAYLSAQADVASLKKLVRSGQANLQDVTDLATAEAALATAESSRDAALDAIFDAGVAGLSGTQSTALSNIRANKSWGTPIEFMVKNRSDQGWLDLAEALTDERVSDLEETSADPACAALLQSERSDSDVSTAKTAFDTNLAAVQSSWTSAVSGS